MLQFGAQEMVLLNEHDSVLGYEKRSTMLQRAIGRDVSSKYLLNSILLMFDRFRGS
jgi:hypothetical protein